MNLKIWVCFSCSTTPKRTGFNLNSEPNNNQKKWNWGKILEKKWKIKREKCGRIFRERKLGLCFGGKLARRSVTVPSICGGVVVSIHRWIGWWRGAIDREVDLFQRLRFVSVLLLLFIFRKKKNCTMFIWTTRSKQTKRGKGVRLAI